MVHPVAPTTPRALALTALSAMLGLGTLACGPEPQQTWPAGTAMVVHLAGDAAPIATADVDAWLETMLRIEPSATLPAQRRYALTNINLHRAVASLIDPAARAEARALAEAARERVFAEAPIELDVPLETLARFDLSVSRGSYRDVGLQAWGMAHDMQVGEWSEVYENKGAFVFFRLVERPPTDIPWTPASGVKIWSAVYPYIQDVDPTTLIEDALDQCRLTILDPAWEEIVPQHYVYRMQ